MKTSLTLDRALQVLDLLGTGPKRVSETATALGLNRTVAHRLLSTLQEKGLAIQVDGRYHVGGGVRPLAQHVETRLRGLATDPAAQLADRTESTVLLVLRSDLLTSVLTFTSPDQREGTIVVPEIGTAHPIFESSHGLAMLAFSEPATIARARRRADDAAHFDRLVAGTRRAGWTSESIDPPPHPLSELSAPLYPIGEFADAALALIPPAGAPHDELVAPLLETCAMITGAMRAAAQS